MLELIYGVVVIGREKLVSFEVIEVDIFRRIRAMTLRIDANKVGGRLPSTLLASSARRHKVVKICTSRYKEREFRICITSIPSSAALPSPSFVAFKRGDWDLHDIVDVTQIRQMTYTVRHGPVTPICTCIHSTSNVYEMKT